MKTKVSFSVSIILLFILSSVILSGCGSANSTTTFDLQGNTPDQKQVEQTDPTKSGVDIDGILSDLEGLSLNSFFEQSFLELSFRYPEDLVSLGLSESVGLDEVTLTNFSDDYIKDTQALERGILEILKSYDRETLSQEDQISYDVYEWYLDDLVRNQEFLYYNYPVTFFIFATHISTEFFFTDNHPILDIQDARDYVTRLSLVNNKFDQLIEGLKIREEKGIISPRFALEWGMSGINGIANSSPKQTSYYSSFNENLDTLAGLSSADKESLLDSAEIAIKESVIPAYKALSAYVNELIHEAPTDDGVWQFPNGEEYYEYTLRHYTSTELSPDEIHQLGLQELERIQSEMRTIFDDLGYPTDESLFDLYQRVTQDGGIIPSHKMIETYESIIDEFYLVQSEVFDLTPRAKVIVVGTPTGGFYTAGTVDGSRPGTFYASMNGGGEPYYLMPSLTYHETIPGHHTQVALAQELNLPAFRNHISLNGYTEGWALYAERLAWEMGLYDSDPYGDLGRLSYEALRAARLVVDTGIHSKGWDFDQATDFFVENVGWGRQACEYQIARYIVLPGQSTGYMIGMLKILELRQSAMDHLGDQFNLKDFHRVVLSNGSIPLSILETLVNQYIEDTLASNT